MDETKQCPWCGETILAVAKKCKHCGEFLTADDASAQPAAEEPVDFRTKQEQWARERFAQQTPGTTKKTSSSERRAMRSRVVPSPKMRDGVLTCPKCGGTSFVPRRKTSTKVAFGLLSLAGRPHHVECATCGQMFDRRNV